MEAGRLVPGEVLAAPAGAGLTPVAVGGVEVVPGAVGLSHQLVEVCTPAEIVPGTGTLLDHSREPFLTYYFEDRDDCFVTGNDPSYYDSLGCYVGF